jgi:hypothetical protein
MTARASTAREKLVIDLIAQADDWSGLLAGLQRDNASKHEVERAFMLLQERLAASNN